MTKTSLLVVLSAFALINMPAHACAMRDFFDINEARNTDAIVIGKITNFKLAKSEVNEMHEYAIFDVGVQQIISGSSPKNVSVIWPSTSNTAPRDLSGKTAIIAFAKNDQSEIVQYGYKPSSKRKTRIVFFQSPCAPAFILNPSHEIVSSIRLALEGGQPVIEPQVPLFPEQLPVSADQPQLPRWKIITAFFAAISLAGGISAYRKARRRNQKNKGSTAP